MICSCGVRASGKISEVPLSGPEVPQPAPAHPTKVPNWPFLYLVKLRCSFYHDAILDFTLHKTILYNMCFLRLGIGLITKAFKLKLRLEVSFYIPRL